MGRKESNHSFPETVMIFFSPVHPPFPRTEFLQNVFVLLFYFYEQIRLNIVYHSIN